HDRYEPFVRRCVAHFRLDPATADEVCQEIWVQIAIRMRSFVYDPNGTFRGWLWTLSRHEAIRFLKRSMTKRTFYLDERDEYALNGRSALNPPESQESEYGAGAGDHEGGVALDWLVREAHAIQAAVRQRVKPHTWEAFWLVGVVFWTV